MGYHIVLSRPFDLEGMERLANEDRSPRHILHALAHRLDAAIHQPSPGSARRIDRVLSKLGGQPEHWALARALAPRLGPDDVVYCAGADTGIPLALLLSSRSRRPQLAVEVMMPERARFRVSMKLFGLDRRFDHFFVDSEPKAASLRAQADLSPSRIHVIPLDTDTRFFTPGPRSAERPRPLVFSAGLERRDYATLAAATQDLDVDVRVCAVSPNASPGKNVAFPDPVPANMSFHPYPWPEFRKAYRDADVVVVSTLENDYSAGSTVVVEALACERPTIVTRAPGFVSDMIDEGYVHGVPPRDPEALRKAILDVLAHPEESIAMAKRGRRAVLERFSSDVVVHTTAEHLSSIASARPRADGEGSARTGGPRSRAA